MCSLRAAVWRVPPLNREGIKAAAIGPRRPKPGSDGAVKEEASAIMPLILTDNSLDWALRHAENWGDTDIFPELFEFAAIRESWSELKATLTSTDILEWSVRPSRRCLVPKHRFGFRVSTQLDPVDLLVFTALIHEVGEKLEAIRVPAESGIVHSYRFHPGVDGRMFSDQFTFRSFQNASHAALERLKPTHVVIADIADFFPRLYTHRIDGALDSALGVGHMHAKALKDLINHWAGTYSYGLPVGSAAARLIAEAAISDVDQLLLSEGCEFVRYSDDFRIFASSEAEAYKQLTLIARALFENHGLTLQQNKTRIVTTNVFRKVYLKENDQHELETLSEQFYDLLEKLGIEDTYGDIDYEALSSEAREAIDQLNLEGILEEQIALDEPDISLLKFILRRLGQLGDTDVVDLIFGHFNKFVPVIRETIEYLLRLEKLRVEKKKELGEKLLGIYEDAEAPASHLEYSRMYLLRPFSVDVAWNSDAKYVMLFNNAVDDFSRRELLLALGRSKQDFWFRSRKQYLSQLSPWLRRAYIYGASCLPSDEYKHWVRGVDAQLDYLERAIALWARKHPIA
jgi:hypothetical protein